MQTNKKTTTEKTNETHLNIAGQHPIDTLKNMPRKSKRHVFYCLHFLEVIAAVKAAYEAGENNPGRTPAKRLRSIIEGIAKKHLFAANLDRACKRGVRYFHSIREVEVRGALKSAFKAGKTAAMEGGAA